MNQYAQIKKNYPKFVIYYIATFVVNICFIQWDGLFLSLSSSIILTAAVFFYKSFYKIPLDQIEQLEEHKKSLKVLLISVNTNVILMCLLLLNVEEWLESWKVIVTYGLSAYFLIPFFSKKSLKLF